MGSAAYNRGSKRIRENIDQEAQAPKVINLREEALAVRNYLDTTRLQEKRINEQEAEIEALRQQLAEAQEKVRLQKAELIMLRDDIAAAQKRVQNMDHLREVYLREMEAHKEKHQILSDIIRLVLTPEQYHQYREIVRSA